MKPTAKSVARIAAIAWVFSLFAFLSLGSVCWVAENETITALFGFALAAIWTASTGVLLATRRIAAADFHAESAEGAEDESHAESAEGAEEPAP